MKLSILIIPISFLVSLLLFISPLSLFLFLIITNLFLASTCLGVSFLIRFSLLLIVNLLSFGMGYLDFIGDSYSVHWFSTEAFVSFVAGVPEALYYKLYIFRFEDFNIGNYGTSLYFYMIGFLKLGFNSINFDIKILNILMTIGFAAIYYKFVKLIFNPAAPIALLLVLLYPLHNVWSLFLLKDLFHLLLTFWGLWILIHLNKQWYRYIPQLLIFLILLFVSRPNVFTFYFAVYLLSFLYYAIPIKKIAIFFSIFIFWKYQGLMGMMNNFFSKFLLLNKGHYSSGGYCFKVMNNIYYFDQFALPEPINYFYYFILGVFHTFIEPNPFNYYNLKYGIFQLLHLIWILLVLLAVVGFVSLLIMGRMNKSLQICIFYIITHAIMLGLVDGNIGTLIRHRSMIEPFVFIFSAVGIWAIFPINRLKNFFLNKTPDNSQHIQA